MNLFSADQLWMWRLSSVAISPISRPSAKSSCSDRVQRRHEQRRRHRLAGDVGDERGDDAVAHEEGVIVAADLARGTRERGDLDPFDLRNRSSEECRAGSSRPARGRAPWPASPAPRGAAARSRGRWRPDCAKSESRRSSLASNAPMPPSRVSRSAAASTPMTASLLPLIGTATNVSQSGNRQSLPPSNVSGFPSRMQLLGSARRRGSPRARRRTSDRA